jgi:hypothetical protein
LAEDVSTLHFPRSWHAVNRCVVKQVLKSHHDNLYRCTCSAFAACHYMTSACGIGRGVSANRLPHTVACAEMLFELNSIACENEGDDAFLRTPFPSELARHSRRLRRIREHTESSSLAEVCPSAGCDIKLHSQALCCRADLSSYCMTQCGAALPANLQYITP